MKIKRYKNRKLYSPELKDYVNLSGIKAAILDNRVIEVIRYDGVDVTRETLIEVLKLCEVNKADLTYLIKQGE